RRQAGTGSASALAALGDSRARQPHGLQPRGEPLELSRGDNRDAVPPAALELVEVDAVAEKSVEPLGRDDPGHVAVRELQLEIRCAQTRRRRARRYRAAGSTSMRGLSGCLDL